MTGFQRPGFPRRDAAPLPDDPWIMGWACGFLDGEGSFTLTEGRYAKVTCAQAGRELLERLQKNFGGTITFAPNAGRVGMHRWTLMVGAEALMVALRPHLSIRRQEQIDAVLGGQETWDARKHRSHNARIDK